MSVRIPMGSKDGITRQWAIVDDDDAAWANQWKWSIHTQRAPYAHRKEWVDGQRFTVLMHRAILGIERGDKTNVDHFNGDKLDNRRSNLRVTTSSGNAQNRRTSGGRYRGVVQVAGRDRWDALLTVSGVKRYIGRFATADEAALAATLARADLMPFSQEAHDFQKAAPADSLDGSMADAAEGA